MGSWKMEHGGGESAEERERGLGGKRIVNSVRGWNQDAVEVGLLGEGQDAQTVQQAEFGWRILETLV
jgi:hypothetical protein